MQIDNLSHKILQLDPKIAGDLSRIDELIRATSFRELTAYDFEDLCEINQELGLISIGFWSFNLLKNPVFF